MDFSQSIDRMAQSLPEDKREQLIEDIFFLSAKAVPMAWDKEWILQSFYDLERENFDPAVYHMNEILSNKNRETKVVQNEFREFIAELNGKSANEIMSMVVKLRETLPKLDYPSNHKKFDDSHLLPDAIRNTLSAENGAGFRSYHLLCIESINRKAIDEGHKGDRATFAIISKQLTGKTAYDIIGMGYRRLASALKIPECAEITPPARDVCTLLMVRKVGLPPPIFKTKSPDEPTDEPEADAPENSDPESTSSEQSTKISDTCWAIANEASMNGGAFVPRH
jgi:hypothetical protein